jgi:hypothetical protein
MPRKGDIETLKIIKADLALCSILVVMISTSSTALKIEE